jgi:hypothetical protein
MLINVNKITKFINKHISMSVYLIQTNSEKASLT